VSEKFQLHPSGLETLSMCGERFRRRYVEQEWAPPSVRMAIGTAVDRSITEDLQSQIEQGRLLPVEQVQDIARDALDREWERGVSTTQEDLSEGLSHSKDSAVDMSVNLAAFHRNEVAGQIEPVAVQWHWVLDIEGLPIQLAGTVDIKERRGVRDTKTSSKAPQKDLADKSLQLTTYALALRMIPPEEGGLGTMPEQVALDYVIQTPKRREAKHYPLVSIRTEADLSHLLERVAQAHRMIQAGLFMPAPIVAWWCSKTFCEFHSTCKYAAHPVSVAVGGVA
jgi:hypothetical protein